MDTRHSLEDAVRLVHAVMAPTPQQRWPLLDRRLGLQAWVKHENHTPLGAFKVRGGLVYFDALKRREPALRGVVCATRGNHGQSVGFAARRHGLAATVVVPHGNSIEKNEAMRALGVELIEHGDDFQSARQHAKALAQARGLHMVPSFHDDLVRGVATGWLEFFGAVEPDVVFVPIGQGSGICACAAARAHLRVSTRIVGVVSAHATAYLLSFRAGEPIESPTSTRLADGIACSAPDAEALAIIRREVDDIVTVTDEEVAEAMRILFADTHNVAEGAGAAGLAAAIAARTRWAGRCVGVPLTGGNVDTAVYSKVLSGA